MGSVSLFLHRIYIAFGRYSANELTNHSGAVAYYFLLSIVPIILLILSVLESVLSSYPELLSEFFSLLEGFNPNLNEEFISRFQISTGAAKAFGVLGVLNLLWTSRLVFSSVQRAFDVIFPAPNKRNFFINAFISIFVIPAVFLLVVVFTTLRIVLGYLEDIMLRIGFSSDLLSYTSYLSVFIPIIASFIGSYLCYRYLPVRKPSAPAAFKGALLFTLLLFLLKTAYGLIINAANLNVLYGVIGTVIILLLWVYFICQAFFICAEFTYVCDKTDVLVINRVFDALDGERKSFVERFVFGKNSKVFKNYSSFYPAGTVLFRQGDESEDIYYVYRGKIDVYLDNNPEPAAHVLSGDMTGEMAHLLKSPRSATAVAGEDSVIFTITPEVFGELIGMNRRIAMRVINTLSDRLRAMNERLS